MALSEKRTEPEKVPAKQNGRATVVNARLCRVFDFLFLSLLGNTGVNYDVKHEMKSPSPPVSLFSAF